MAEEYRSVLAKPFGRGGATTGRRSTNLPRLVKPRYVMRGARLPVVIASHHAGMASASAQSPPHRAPSHYNA